MFPCKDDGIEMGWSKCLQAGYIDSSLRFDD